MRHLAVVMLAALAACGTSGTADAPTAMTYRQTTNGQTTDVSETDSGYWVRDGDQVRLQSTVPGGGFFFATYVTGSLTFSDPGFVQVFTRS